MAKIPNDKYYTPTEIVEHCVNKVKEIIDDDVFALSELVQWCWRGQVRSSLPMTICIGSKRMYELFMNWLNDDDIKE